MSDIIKRLGRHWGIFRHCSWIIKLVNHSGNLFGGLQKATKAKTKAIILLDVRPTEIGTFF